MTKDDAGRERIQAEQTRRQRKADETLRCDVDKDEGLKRDEKTIDEEIESVKKKPRREEPSKSSSSSSRLVPMQESAAGEDIPSKRTRIEDDEGESGKKTKKDINGVDVAEVYSPPRMIVAAAKIGLSPGFSMDIATCDENSVKWDFNIKAMRNKAIRKAIDEKPLVLMTNPMCTDWSIAMNANWGRMTAEERRTRMMRARIHLDLVCQLHAIQHNAGRYFIHEHPQSATSWNEECIRTIMKETRARMISVSQCMYGLTGKDKGEELRVRKPTTFMTNMPALSVMMYKNCDGQHKHVTLGNGRKTKAAQRYPDELCMAIVKAIKIQKQWDAEGVYLIGNVSINEFKDALKIPAEEDEKWLQEAMGETAWDDISGEFLDADKVKEARRAEMSYYRKMGVYKKVPIKECLEKTGKPPIGVRWVDVNKGDRKAPLYRSRLVAKEFKKYKDDDLFAATPPIESFRAVISSATTGEKEKAIMVNDVSRAYMYADCEDDIYVELCAEDQEGDEGKTMCGELAKAMYGTRPAAKMWQKEGTMTLTDA
jgi:hypothetical protein